MVKWGFFSNGEMTNLQNWIIKIFPYPENFPPLVGRDFLQVCLRLDGNGCPPLMEIKLIQKINIRLDGNWQMPLPHLIEFFNHFSFEGFPRSFGHDIYIYIYIFFLI